MAVKAGDILLGRGDVYAALELYHSAVELCAMHGSVRGMLSVGNRIQRAQPDRVDVYLALGRSLLEQGHAASAVEVLQEHARQANDEQMQQELQPLVGRPSEDIKPLVSMLLEGTGPAEPVVAPPSIPAPPPAPAPSPPPVRPSEPKLAPVVLPTYAVPPPQPPPPPAPEPTRPQFAPTPLPPPPVPQPPPLPLSLGAGPEDVGVVELGSIVPGDSREGPPAESPRLRRPSVGGLERPSTTVRQSQMQRRSQAMAAPRQSRGGLWAILVIAALGTAGWLAYTGKLPGTAGLAGALRPGGTGSDDSAATPAAGTGPVVPAPTDSPRAAPPAPLRPPVLIAGLVVDSMYRLVVTGGVGVWHRDSLGQYILLLASPAADTAGEPALGEVRVDSVPGDVSAVTTSFAGYIVSVRGLLSPAELRRLLRLIYLVPPN